MYNIIALLLLYAFHYIPDFYGKLLLLFCALLLIPLTLENRKLWILHEIYIVPLFGQTTLVPAVATCQFMQGSYAHIIKL